jgi:hypothetical protein
MNSDDNIEKMTSYPERSYHDDARLSPVLSVVLAGCEKPSPVLGIVDDVCSLH